MKANKKDYSAKIKLLKIMELLKNETDEDHPISRQTLCDRLNEMGISSNVRTLSKDIAVLNEFGYEIISEMRKHERYYYVGDRNFSLPEVRILIDSVEAANFITEKKTKELTSRVIRLCGKHEAEELKHSFIEFNTTKLDNEHIYYLVLELERAIREKKCVSFHYFDLDYRHKKVFRKDENTGGRKTYLLEPIGLVCNEDNYYLIACNPRHESNPGNYRVDRIEKVQVLDTPVSDVALGHAKNIPELKKQMFKMFQGEPRSVTLKFDQSLLNPVFDKFGKKCKIEKNPDGTCTLTQDVMISPVFFGWLFQYGDKMTILSPDDVRDEYLDHLSRTLFMYPEDEETLSGQEEPDDPVN